MKLLLTSAGITNKSLAKTLKRLVKGRIRIAFIPTAANSLDSKKDWLIKNYNECEKLGPVDIVDISAIDKKNWLQRLKKANVIVVGGGDTKHLANCMAKSGLKTELPSLLKNRVYVGISAGSIVTAKRISASSEFLYEYNPKNAPFGLGLHNFNVRSHFNSSDFPKVRDKYLRAISQKLEGDLYALDDDSAVLLTDGKIKVISEGRWKRYSHSAD